MPSQYLHGTTHIQLALAQSRCDVCSWHLAHLGKPANVRFAPEAVIQKLSLRGAVVQLRKADSPYDIPFSYLGDSLRPNPASRPITTACARLLAPSLLKIIDT
jgi:hypothetical protein